MRFRSEQHLRRQSDIRAVREQGRRCDCGAFTIWWKFRPAPDPALAAAPLNSRVCVIASTAAVGGAIQRNRAKRRLREVFRATQNLVPAGCDLLLIARNSTLRWNFLELEKKFVSALRQTIAPSHAP